MKRKMTAALMTFCMIMGSVYLVPAVAAGADELPPEAVSVQYEETETETETEAETEAETETVTETEAETVTETEAETVTETEAETEAWTETAAAAVTETETETETAFAAEMSETETEISSETESETEPETETETEIDPGYLYDQLRQAAMEEDEEAVLLEAGTSTKRNVKAVGVDVWNGNGKIDWAKAKKAGVQFAIIRVGFRYLKNDAYEVDARAKENMNGAKAAGVPFGVYFFSTAKTVTEGLEEAKCVINTIRNYKLDYPVFFDPEGYDIPGIRNHGVSNSDRTNIALKFMAYIENNGYEAAMYSSKSHLTNNSYWETNKLEASHDIWVAQYPGGLNTLASGKTAQTTYQGKYRIWQFSSSGSVSGISSDVDLNVEYYESAYMTGVKAPEVLTAGSTFAVSGNVVSETPITKVTTAVFDAGETVKLRAFAYPNTVTYNVSASASKLRFQDLAPGIYRYQVNASNSAGSRTLIRQPFIVQATGRTVADGTYTLALRDNTKLVSGIKGRVNTVPANMVMAADDNENNHAKFQVRYDKDGFYKITVLGSGKALSVNGTVAAGRTVAQTASAIRWQILPYGDGSYALVPEGTDGCVVNAGESSGTVVKLAKADISPLQCFTLKKTSYFEPLSIAGENLPKSIKQGWAFKPAGTVSSEKALKSVNVRVYSADGTTMLDKTVTTSGKTYDLSKMQSAINFRTLAPGMYVYRVTAKNASQSKVLAKKAFAVLNKEKTVADGVYSLLYTGNTGFAATVAGKSNAAGGNICLGTYNANDNYMKFTVKYISNGYYTIRCAGSGKYLSAADQTAAAGINLVQKDTAFYWQIMKNGSGYALIPAVNWQSVMYLVGGLKVNGRNIRLEEINTSATSRWTLKKTTVSGKPAVITGYNLPGTLNVGQSYSIRGKITSTTKLTKVNVGIYDAAGKVKSYQSVSPNSLTFDIKAVDPKIKFGSLTAGTYYYRVVAINGYGTTRLINQKFTVR